MSEELARVTVRILDKEYQVACPDEERSVLVESAELLNRQMLEIRAAGKVIGLDRIAVMAALNLAHEILQQRSTADLADQALLARLRTLNDQIAVASGAAQTR